MTDKAINEVKGKVAIVTGAASGIGRATAELLHARGAMVVAEDINPEVENLARPGIATLVADVSADGSAERAVALALQQFGRLGRRDRVWRFQRAVRASPRLYP
jgi:NAD(P)-dependent dehydrogenase (short-subunit alcohol dehydrogenase family)